MEDIPISVVNEDGEETISLTPEGEETATDVTSETITVIGQNDYEELDNLPQVNGVELKGNKTNSELGIPTKTSQLQNDSGFITNAPVTSVNGETGDVTVDVPTKTSDLTNDSGFITGYTETDPTVPSWAKQSTKPTYSYSEITDRPTTPTKTSDLTNDGASGSSTYVEASELSEYVTLDTNQNITGEKTFVGDKRIKFKGTTSSSKLGFTTYDNTGGETGFLEVQGASNASKKVRLGCYDQNSGGNARDNYVGFQYYNTKPVGGGTINYNLVCPPQYKGVSGTSSYAYIPIDFTDGTTTVRADVDGVLNLSSLLPPSVTVVQTTGQSTTDVMSQKAVTDTIGDIETVLNTLNNGGGAQ